MTHVHEFFYAVTDGRRAGWPAERCLGNIPGAEVAALLSREEPTITPHGTVTGVTVWRRAQRSPQFCWLAGRGFVI
jgi:hypothetical protein